jgi:archaellum component FlaC
MNVEAEIRDLKRRVGELEGSFGFLMEQVKGIHRDLLGFQEMTEQRFDGIESEIGAVKVEVRTLRDDLPEIVGDAVRSVLRPGDR